MGLLDKAPPNGATRAGLSGILGACQPAVKRKWLVMSLYPYTYEWLSPCSEFRLQEVRRRFCHPSSDVMCVILHAGSDRGGHHGS